MKRLGNSAPFTPQPPALRRPVTRSSPRFEAAELDDAKCSAKSKTLSQKLSLSSKKQMASAKAALEKQLQESSSSDNVDGDDDDDDDEKDQDLSQNLLSPSVPNGTVSTVARQLVESQLTVSTGLDEIYEGAYDDVEGEKISARGSQEDVR